MSEYELYHFGVKGMKWGVRRKRPKMTSEERKAARAEKKQFKRDVKAYKKGQYKDPHDLSFTARTRQDDNGDIFMDKMRYYSGNKRISEKKFNELNEYSYKLAAQAAKDVQRQQRGATVVSGLLLSGLTVAALIGSR